MASWTPPAPTYHLRVFAISLALVFIALVAFLFAVRMEAIVPATGIITARELEDVRVPLSGLIDPGWSDEKTFHRLEPGDVLSPGQALATVRPEGKEPHVLRVPEGSTRWQVVTVHVTRGQAVDAGDLVARIVPLDPETGQPRDLLARLEFEEKHVGDLAPGQLVRLESVMYNPRLHGHAEAVLERLDPMGEPAAAGDRRFYATARVTRAPFRLPLGSTFKAEVVVGRKAVYRIILEQ
jgi:hypothetical protein